MEAVLKEGERLDELQRNSYRIIQDPRRFCFGMDAVLLAGFARVKPKEQVLDLGTGTGIIPILLKGRTKGKSFTGLEIQERSAATARKKSVLPWGSARSYSRSSIRAWNRKLFSAWARRC